MKIRINGNSIRIRLSRSEVSLFAETGKLEEKTEFGNAALVYALQAREGISALEADFNNGRITMYVPAGIPAQWAVNDTVGYDNNFNIGGGRRLSLLLEKDFKCLDNATEDQSDNYENPNKVC